MPVGQTVPVVANQAAIGLDVGSTAVKGVLVGPDGEPAVVRRWPTDRPADQSAVLDRVLRSARELIAAADRRVVAVGIAVPGVVDEEAGIARFAANLPFRDFELGRLAAAELRLPVAVSHDVRAAARAEARTGRDLYFVTLGTGVGAARILAGELDAGANALAGQLGHVVVRPGGVPCGCGGSGHLGSYASATGLARTYTELTGDPAAAHEVVQRAVAGDPAAGHAWAATVDALADGLALVTTLIDPGSVVLGGGLSLAGDRLLDPLRGALAARLTFQRLPALRAATYPAYGGAVGAAVRAQLLARGFVPPAPAGGDPANTSSVGER